jgi:hypothetical protein
MHKRKAKIYNVPETRYNPNFIIYLELCGEKTEQFLYEFSAFLKENNHRNFYFEPRAISSFSSIENKLFRSVSNELIIDVQGSCSYSSDTYVRQAYIKNENHSRDALAREIKSAYIYNENVNLFVDNFRKYSETINEAILTEALNNNKTDSGIENTEFTFPVGETLFKLSYNRTTGMIICKYRNPKFGRVNKAISIQVGAQFIDYDLSCLLCHTKNEEASERWNYMSNEKYLNTSFTIREVYCLVEILTNHKRVVKRYGKELVNAFVGRRFDPFTSTIYAEAVSALSDIETKCIDDYIEMRDQLIRERTELNNSYNEKLKSLKADTLNKYRAEATNAMSSISELDIEVNTDKLEPKLKCEMYYF